MVLAFILVVFAVQELLAHPLNPRVNLHGVEVGSEADPVEEEEDNPCVEEVDLTHIELRPDATSNLCLYWHQTDDVGLVIMVTTFKNVQFLIRRLGIAHQYFRRRVRVIVEYLVYYRYEALRHNM